MKKILIVDDLEINRLILQEILADAYETDCAADGIDALSKLVNSLEKPDLVLLDIMMPGMDGFEVIKYMKSDSSLSKIPVIFITAADQEAEGLSAGALDYISKPFTPSIVKLRIANQLELSSYRENLEQMVDKKVEELIRTKEKFLHTMAELIEYRSPESNDHVKRTKELARILVLELVRNSKYSEELLDQDFNALIDAVPLHDIGKIGIPDNILLKPGKLTPEEYDIIKTHANIGGAVIKSLVQGDDDDEYLGHCFNICNYHHERWDGKGYPKGLKSDEIPLAARILAIVDVYDALVSERCYKKAMPHEQAIEIIKEGSGTQFDPDLVDVLLKINDRFKNCKLPDGDTMFNEYLQPRDINELYELYNKK